MIDGIERVYFTDLGRIWEGLLGLPSWRGVKFVYFALFQTVIIAYNLKHGCPKDRRVENFRVNCRRGMWLDISSHPAVGGLFGGFYNIFRRNIFGRSLSVLKNFRVAPVFSGQGF